MRSKAYPVALGGMLAAAAVVMMCIGTIIPVATYAAPVLCMMICQTVLKCCGSRIAWAWYAVVAILGLLLAPDKEAAAVFLALGYYPVVKPKLDRMRGKWLWKGLLFNGSVLALYWILLKPLKSVFASFAVPYAIVPHSTLGENAPVLCTPFGITKATLFTLLITATPTTVPWLFHSFAK